MEIIKAFLRIIRSLFFKLNESQRKHVSKLFDTVAVGSIIPVFIKLLDNDNPNDTRVVVVCLVCAILLEILSIAALAAGDDE